MRDSNPPNPAPRNSSGSFESRAAKSCQWCSVASIPGAWRLSLSCSRCSTSSLTGDAPGGMGSSSGTAASGSSRVACPNGSDREDLTSARPMPLAARPLTSLPSSRSQPGTLSDGSFVFFSAASQPDGGWNCPSSTASTGLKLTLTSSVRLSGLPSNISSCRSKMPSSASTMTSTRSTGRRHRNAASLMLGRGVATTRHPSRPRVVAEPPISSV